MDLILIIAGVGLLLMLAEVFLPGGVLGVIGGLALVVAVVMGYVQSGLLAGTILLVGLGGTALVGFAIWMSLFPRTAAGRKFMLSGSLVPGSGGPAPSQSLVGMAGVALTPLRPAGKALVDGRRLDVVAENEFVDADAEIVVVAADGARIVVRRKV